MTATKQAIDFTNVKEGPGIRPKRKPEGDYRAKVLSVEDHTSQAGGKGWQFIVALTTDSRATYPYHCQFDEKQAWKIRALCMAAGLQVPKKKMAVDPNKLVGKEIGVSLEDDEYDNKIKSTIAGVFPTSELSADSPSSTGRSKSKASASTASAASDDDDDDDVVDGEEDELDLEEL